MNKFVRIPAQGARITSQFAHKVVRLKLLVCNLCRCCCCSYESANGIKAEARGQPGQGPPGEEGENVQGSFSYVGDDGQTYSITYTADENGFVPQGAHLPTPPPIPPEIQRALEFNEKNPEPEEGAARKGR